MVVVAGICRDGSTGHRDGGGHCGIPDSEGSRCGGNGYGGCHTDDCCSGDCGGQGGRGARSRHVCCVLRVSADKCKNVESETLCSTVKTFSWLFELKITLF